MSVPQCITHTHARTHAHTHTLVLVLVLVHVLSQPDLAAGNKTPLAMETPASPVVPPPPLGAVGILIYGLARLMK